MFQRESSSHNTPIHVCSRLIHNQTEWRPLYTFHLKHCKYAFQYYRYHNCRTHIYPVHCNLRRDPLHCVKEQGAPAYRCLS